MSDLIGVDNGVVESVEEISSADVTDDLTDMIEDAGEESLDISSDEAGSSDDAWEAEDEVDEDDRSSEDVGEDLRYEVLSADGPEDFDGHPGGDPTQEQESGELPAADSTTSQPSSDFITLHVMDERLVIDESIYPREKIDQLTVKSYVRALRAGAQFPPLVVIWRDGKWIVIDGGHRLNGLRKYLTEDYRTFFNETSRERTNLKEKTGASEDDIHLPPMPASPPEEILCQIVTIPEEQSLILVAYSYNRRHGLRPSAADQKKTARTVYKAGMSLVSLAGELGISPKTVRSYVADLVNAYEEARNGLILHFCVQQQLSDEEIAAELERRYPYSRGISAGSVSRSISDAKKALLGSRVGKPAKKYEKGAPKKDSSAKPPISKDNNIKGSALYPPSTSAGNPSGAASSVESVTSSTGSAITPAPMSTTASAAAKSAMPSQDAGGKDGALSVESSSRPKNIFDKNDSNSLPFPKTATHSITGSDGSVVTIDDSGFSFFVNELKRAVKIIPHDLWDFGGYLVTEIAVVFVNILYFFSDRGDHVVVVSHSDQTSLASVCGSMDRKFVSIEDGCWPDQARLVFVNSLIPAGSRPDPGLHMMLVRQTLKEACDNVGSANLALLCGCWTDDIGRPVSVFDYVDAIKKSGWTAINCISVPRPVDSIPGKVLIAAVQDRKLAHIGCYIIIAEKEFPAIPAESASTTVSENDNNINSPETDSQTQTVE